MPTNGAKGRESVGRVNAEKRSRPRFFRAGGPKGKEVTRRCGDAERGSKEDSTAEVAEDAEGEEKSAGREMSKLTAGGAEEERNTDLR